MDHQVRILIVDDHPMAREGMKEILAEEKSFNIVGVATSGKEAVKQTEVLMPDLILMDIHLPELNGMEATRLIKSKYPYVKIVMVTVSDDIVDLFESIKNGAQGYLLKHVEHDSWIPYLKSIMNNDVQIDKPIAKQILKEFSNNQIIEDDKKDSLSNREKEILTLVANGLTNKEISQRLEISEYTVKNHLKNLFQKLHLNNRVQLAKYAYEHGYLKDL